MYFLITIYILTNRITNISKTHFEKATIYQYSLIWNSLIKRLHILMEQQVSSITRDKDLLKSITENNRAGIASSIAPTFNRLLASETLDGIRLFNKDGVELWSDIKSSNDSSLALVAKRSLTSRSIETGFSASDEGHTFYNFAFPIFDSRAFIGVALFSRNLNSESISIFNQKNISVVVSKNHINAFDKDTRNNFETLNKELIKEFKDGNSYYRMVGLPIHDFDNHPISGVYFTRNISEDYFAQQTSLRIVYLISILLLAACLIILYQFVVREGARLLDLEENKNTQLAHANKLMKEANNSKNNFLSKISHELRTPLNGILSLIELVRQRPLDDDQRNDLDTMKGCANHLSKMVDTIFEFSSLSSNAQAFQSEVFSVQKLVAGLVKEQITELKQKSIELILDFSKNSPKSIKSDPKRLRRIFECLISNAIKFSKIQGCVIIFVESIKEVDQKLLLHCAVSNTGMGIPKDKQSDIFTQFNQLDNSKTREHEGIGLGLTITKMMVESMNGRIWLNSKNNIGSAFHFIIEIQEASLDSEEESSSATSSNIQCIEQTNNVLVIEDYPPDQSTISRTLNLKGFNVQVATTGVQALKVANQQNFDFILMDINLPDINGLELTKSIKGSKSINNNTPIITLTSENSSSLERTYHEIGMYGYLTKPLCIENLNKIISLLPHKTT
jgi:signal transduction histidine kinase/CheY-like chemotaxis protein